MEGLEDLKPGYIAEPNDKLDARHAGGRMSDVPHLSPDAVVGPVWSDTARSPGGPSITSTQEEAQNARELHLRRSGRSIAT
jgi:hypothetical protein